MAAVMSGAQMQFLRGQESDVTRLPCLVTDTTGRGPPASRATAFVFIRSPTLMDISQSESSKRPEEPIRAEIRSVALRPSGSVMYRTLV